MSLLPVSRGQLAAVVTYLEMLRRPPPRPVPVSPLRLVRWKEPDPARYLILFRRIGEPWLWFSRLVMSEEELTATIRSPDLEIYAVSDPNGIEVGMIELDFRTASECELAFFGLVPQLTGQGLGHWMMENALSLAWRKGIERVHVHTCTLDDASALSFYIKAGFRPYARAVEIFDDPRLLGLIAQDKAGHVPLIAR